MSTFLERILAHKRVELAARRTELPEADLERQAREAPAPRRVLDRLGVERVGVIAEVKRASPSRGAIALDMDAATQARSYDAGGADAISVLTDAAFYGGSLDDVRAIRRAVRAPVMRKDFILDRYGLLEARVAGADMVLLIVAALDRTALSGLVEETRRLGMTPLVEVYNEAETEMALAVGAELVGINNRNLHTFEVTLETTERLAPLLAPHALVVSLSGMSGAGDVRRMVEAGARAVLVGEALVRAADPAALIREMAAVPLTAAPPATPLPARGTP